jgi:hypothetical protein
MKSKMKEAMLFVLLFFRACWFEVGRRAGLGRRMDGQPKTTFL